MPKAPSRHGRYLRVSPVAMHGGGFAWKAKISIDGARCHLGTWSDEREAAIASDRAALYFELDVVLNEPAESRRRGPASPEELLTTARRTSVKRKGSSRFFGVVRASDGRFRASISEPGKRRSIAIATFEREEEAALAYDRVALAMHSANARLNFPDRIQKPATIAELRREIGARMPEDKSSRFVGVYWVPRRKRWHASITVDTRVWSLGQWKEERDAALAYDRAALHFFGSDARRNLPKVRVAPASPEEIRREQTARRRKTMTSRYEGVCRHAQGWLAYVNVHGQHRGIGVYRTEEAAAVAHDRATLHLLPVLADAARRNFPERRLAPASIEALKKERRASIKASRTSDYDGVAFIERLGKWQSSITVGRRGIVLGHFDDEEDAALAYDRAVLHFRGAAAKRNFPERRFRPATPEEIHLAQWKRYKEETTSAYTGVQWSIAAGAWVANIVVEGRTIRLGVFDDEVTAARAYDRAARKYRGDAQLPQWVNFPDEGRGRERTREKP